DAAAIVTPPCQCCKLTFTSPGALRQGAQELFNSFPRGTRDETWWREPTPTPSCCSEQTTSVNHTGLDKPAQVTPNAPGRRPAGRRARGPASARPRTPDPRRRGGREPDA